MAAQQLLKDGISKIDVDVKPERRVISIEKYDPKVHKGSGRTVNLDGRRGGLF